MSRTLACFALLAVGLLTPVAAQVSAPAGRRQNTAGQAGSGTQQPTDQSRVRRAGIRQLTGRHLTLYTDLARGAEVDRLPDVFDQAVPQWAAYFGVSAERAADWHVEACLIKNRRRFDAAGLMPAAHDQFAHGISIGGRLWLYEQPTAYYRRHLLLHEGTHAFMATFLGGCGPGWYMEGTAELLATHRLEQKGVRNLFPGRDVSHRREAEKVPDTFLRLRILPRSRAEVPMLGRIKLVRDAFADGHPLTLPEVMRIDNRQALENEAYAWCWAAAVFLDSHPRYRQRFRGLQRHVLDRDFNDVVGRQYAADWSDLLVEWQAFVATLEHGYDFERMAIDFQRGRSLGGRRQVAIEADRGWQSSGLWLEAGRAYRVSAAGRYQIAEEKTPDGEQPWWCEPGGVTIQYHDGHPLGILLGAIDPRTNAPAAASDGQPPDANEAAPGPGGFVRPLVIGLECTIKPAASGTLYMRVNDSGGRLDDNGGRLTVTVEPAR